MMIKKRLAIAVTAGRLLSGAAIGTAAAVSSGRYLTATSYTMAFGSSGNIYKAAPAGGPLGVGTVGSVLPGGCALIGVGDYIPSTPCGPVFLATPYQLTETPLAASNGVFTYFTVTTTNPAPAAGPANRIVFSIRLCESGPAVCAPGGGITRAGCSPNPGSKTCSWIGKLPFEQWQPSGPYACVGGICHGSDPGHRDEGLIDVVASRGCNRTCPNGTYDPGHVSWSVAYIK